MLHRQRLSTSGNPSKVFMCLELRVVPVKFVIMTKLLNMLHSILNESTSSTNYQVYEVLKKESRKGDFYNLSRKYLKDLNMNLKEEQIQGFSKTKWKTCVKNVIKHCAFQYLILENSKLKNTKEIILSELRSSEYLLNNRNTKLCKNYFQFKIKNI